MSNLEDIKNRLAAATPGPWTTSPYGKNHADDGLWVTTVKDRTVIADMTMERGEDWEDQLRTDMTFIAHAPEDVARLVKALEAVEAICLNAETPWVTPKGVVATVKIRAAITEALDS